MGSESFSELGNDMNLLQRLAVTYLAGFTLASGLPVSLAFGTAQPDEKALPERDSLSIVLLQSEVAELSREVLTKKVETAWAADTAPSDKKKAITASGFSVTKLPSKNDRFVIKTADHRFTLELLSEPYVDKSAISAVSDLRNKKMLLDHRGFIAISFAPETAQEVSSKAKKNIYRKMGAVIASLVNDKTLGVMLPAEEILATSSSSLAEHLSSEDPIQALKDAWEVPVVDASEEDAEMKQAVVDAKKAWPRFVTAFKKQEKNTESFGVKFPFDTPDKKKKEFMWVQVTKITDDLVIGTLANDPVLAQDIKFGDAVEKKISEMSDWMYYRDGELVGGFSVKVLMEREAAKEAGDSKAASDQSTSPK